MREAPIFLRFQGFKVKLSKKADLLFCSMLYNLISYVVEYWPSEKNLVNGIERCNAYWIQHTEFYFCRVESLLFLASSTVKNQATDRHGKMQKDYRHKHFPWK